MMYGLKLSVTRPKPHPVRKIGGGQKEGEPQAYSCIQENLVRYNEPVLNKCGRCRTGTKEGWWRWWCDTFPTRPARTDENRGRRTVGNGNEIMDESMGRSQTTKMGMGWKQAMWMKSSERVQTHRRRTNWSCTLNIESGRKTWAIRHKNAEEPIL